MRAAALDAVAPVRAHPAPPRAGDAAGAGSAPFADLRGATAAARRPEAAAPAEAPAAANRGPVGEGARGPVPGEGRRPAPAAAFQAAVPREAPRLGAGVAPSGLSPTSLPTPALARPPQGAEPPAVAAPARSLPAFEPCAAPGARRAADDAGAPEAAFEAPARWPRLPGEAALPVAAEPGRADWQPWPPLPDEAEAPPAPARWSADRRARLDGEQRGQRWSG
ncbi:MAG: hypothetical protein OEU93_15895 [Rubrivivax sp.]|nr:hypothetical protein [Rubrivivax sp.]